MRPHCRPAECPSRTALPGCRTHPRSFHDTPLGEAVSSCLSFCLSPLSSFQSISPRSPESNLRRLAAGVLFPHGLLHHYLRALILGPLSCPAPSLLHPQPEAES